MAVGDVRVLNPPDIPSGIDLPSGSSARDYVIIVGNTNPAIDAVANFVVRQTDRWRLVGSRQALTSIPDLTARAKQSAATPPQQVFETRCVCSSDSIYFARNQARSDTRGSHFVEVFRRHRPPRSGTF
jgi:hypothetical protein